MKKIFTFIVLALLISCSNDDNGNQPIAETIYHQVFFENSKLVISPDRFPEQLKLDVVTGDKLVFKFLRYEDPSSQLIDDENIAIVYFEIDSNATEFKLDKNNFNNANALIGLGASIRILQRISKGSISGEKISENEWKINLNVAFKYEDINDDVITPSSTIFNRSVYEGMWMPIYLE